jgi:hypothetical protein
MGPALLQVERQFIPGFTRNLRSIHLRKPFSLQTHLLSCQSLEPFIKPEAFIERIKTHSAGDAYHVF